MIIPQLYPTGATIEIEDIKNYNNCILVYACPQKKPLEIDSNTIAPILSAFRYQIHKNGDFITFPDLCFDIKDENYEITLKGIN